MKKTTTLLIALLVCLSLHSQKKRIYHNSGGEIIFSGADVAFNGMDVNTNLRFTLFFHTQHLLNLDVTNNIGLFTGFGIRNVGLITEDLYQNVGFLNIDNTHPDFDKNVKIKRRSYSLGFPIALKLGSFSKHFFLFGGYEWEWMFHYKQKLFIDDQKFKDSFWTSDRVNAWVPSVFAGIQLPAGVRLKFKYYMDNFLDPTFTGIDFGEQVDYSTFNSTGIWYVSVAFFMSQGRIKELMGGGFETSAYRH